MKPPTLHKRSILFVCQQYSRTILPTKADCLKFKHDQVDRIRVNRRYYSDCIIQGCFLISDWSITFDVPRRNLLQQGKLRQMPEREYLPQ